MLCHGILLLLRGGKIDQNVLLTFSVNGACSVFTPKRFVIKQGSAWVELPRIGTQQTITFPLYKDIQFQL